MLNVSHRSIDAGGLKSIFPIFMGRGLKKKYYERDEIQKMEELGCDGDLVLTVVVSLLSFRAEIDCRVSIVGSLLKFAADERLDRLVSKFVDDDFEKIDRLVELYLRYRDRVAAVDARFARGSAGGTSSDLTPDEAEDVYLERLGAVRGGVQGFDPPPVVSL